MVSEVETVVMGKTHQVRLALACLFANGHLLIEDLPGMGKTTLAHTLAGVLGFSFKRIQFTSDLLPADIIGAPIFDGREQRFEFQPGPVFSQLLLADEINRATPKAQSALLEAMEERQVSVDGTTHPLPVPFFVIATQNPISQTGTFPLPESQLDRFLMRIELGYPAHEAERRILQGSNPRESISELKQILGLDQLRLIQQRVESILVADPLLDYVQRLVHFSRQCSDFDFGLSPRGALALVRSARAWALIEGRDYVIPEDVQQVLPCVAEHRLRGGRGHSGHRGITLTRQLIDAVDVLE
ncbi:MoxR family ATPase [Motiliproteus sp. MSK22-1]|uniref:AAA family ATPase n=1 Tax=Motiliproteus sp. MSK22-1 TaxID=1897630 RepID=UPI000976F662|nr:MoxR family ATPase [Motiliproteus sp. MSK22-1]OMH34031.1 AAA family ATPase [Motiliproteus sp. MSK22-1]